MAYSNVTYTGTGAQALYGVPFPYLSKSYVKVRIDGVLKTEGVDYSWPNTGSILLAGNLAGGAVLSLKRETPKAAKLVDFQDGSVLTEADLDRSADQVFHLVQETLDDSEAALKLGEDGLVDATNHRIVNVADPVNAQDAATKAYSDQTQAAAVAAVNAAGAAQVASATTQAGSAASSASAAATSATNAAGSATAAAISATNAATSATNAATSATNAANSATTATNAPVSAPTHAAASKATPVDADEVPLVDSAASFGLKRLTWANLKATLLAYFNTVYTAINLLPSLSGNSGKFLTNNGSALSWGAVAAGVGEGQSWQNATGSRVKGTTYYNTYGRTIIVHINCTENAVNSYSGLTVGGVLVASNNMANGGNVNTATISAVVPPGASYVWADIGGIATLTSWLELR